jgi:hypothetical protein
MKVQHSMAQGPSNSSSEMATAPFEQKQFGKRLSAHSGWCYCEPNDITEFDGWSHEGADFLCRLGEENEEMKIKVVAESRDGEVTNEIFIDPSDFEGTQIQLIELGPESFNILFDPVPWKNGERKKKTRFGWLTLSGCHPFGSFPEPVAYWAIGPHAYQLIIPWHMPVKLEDSCEASLFAAPFSVSADAQSKIDDLLYMPGSIIHAGRLPPFTAFMKYDAFSVSELDDRDKFWANY